MHSKGARRESAILGRVGCRDRQLVYPKTQKFEYRMKAAGDNAESASASRE